MAKKRATQWEESDSLFKVTHGGKRFSFEYTEDRGKKKTTLVIKQGNSTVRLGGREINTLARTLF